MKKITRLTSKQKAAIPAHIEKWNKIALSTEPIDFELAKESVIKLYKLSGLKQPEQVIKISSPLEIIKIKPYNAVWHKVWHTVRNAIDNTIDNTINNAVYNVVNNEVYNAFTSEFWDVVRNAINPKVYGGSIWSGDYAEHSFYRDILNIELPDIYNISEQLALNSTFSLFFKNTAYICDRPQSINIQIINDRGIFHNTSGPAVLWRDNFKQWYIEGVRVDEQIVMKPETQTITQINREENQEIKRIRIERYGWLKYLKKSGAKLINCRTNERDNQQEQLYEHEESNRFVCIDPSTGRKYAIAVPHRIRTCLAAQKYLSHGLDKFAIHRS